LGTSNHTFVRTLESTVNANQVKHSRILHGIQLHRPSLTFSRVPVALEQEAVCVQKDIPSKLEVHATACAMEHSLLEQGYTKAAASQTVAWTAASSQVSDRSDVTYISGRLNIAERAISTDFGALTPNPQFVDDIQRAVEVPTTREQEIALEEILERWGHVVPTWVEVGSAIATTLKVAKHDYQADIVSPTHVPSDLALTNNLLQTAEVAAKEALLMKLYGAHDKGAVSEVMNKAEELARNILLNNIGGPRKVLMSSRSVEEWIDAASQDLRGWYVERCYPEASSE
jgi:hypothetical protein